MESLNYNWVVGNIGSRITNDKMLKTGGYYPLVYEYHEKIMDHHFKWDEATYNECIEVMTKDVAIINVYFSSNRFTKTVMDKRLTFSDKLSSFGKFYLLVDIAMIIELF